jgi:hypothetical protein
MTERANFPERGREVCRGKKASADGRTPRDSGGVRREPAQVRMRRPHGAPKRGGAGNRRGKGARIIRANERPYLLFLSILMM